MSEDIKSRLGDIQLLALDVDGVLTNGTLVINADGSEGKLFNSLDGHGIRMWKRAGFKVAFISGRHSPPTLHRAIQLDIDFCFQDCHDKLPVLKDILKQTQFSSNQVAYIGDDLPDLPLVKFVGFGVAVANAVDELKEHADFITSRKAGSGAVREVIEYILKANGKWQQLMKRYLTE